MGYGGALPKTWASRLTPEIVERAQALSALAQAQREEGKSIYPSQRDIFRGLALTSPEEVSCVILGQDPYHGPGQAMGLAFSVPEGLALPPSLKNIYKELVADCGIPMPKQGDLTSWARQGVLLLNTSLTVEEGKAASHAKWGWQLVTQGILEVCARLTPPPVFLLWGNHAQKAASNAGIGLAGENVIVSAHPSPLSASRGFFGSRPFSKVNELLAQSGRQIAWDSVATKEHR